MNSNDMSSPQTGSGQRMFWGCFAALVATSFGFIIRALIMNDWAAQYGLSETQKGEIFGVGLWPFAISIVLFSLVIDHIGYGRAMVFAFVCHVASAVITILAPRHFDPYWSLYIGNFVVALANGTVEAVVNPVVATMYSREKTKWLNILHAGWPGGLVLGGLLTLGMGQFLPSLGWEWKVGLLLVPTIVYGLMLIGQRFPIHERVAAGVSYRDMLKEAGALGALIVAFLMTWEIGRVFDFPTWLKIAVLVVLTGGYGLYVKSLGRPMFVLLLIIMVPLATTELGVDSWVTDLMTPVMGANAGWVLVYTSFIMMILRFCAGPIVHRLSPIGLLATCSAIAAAGLIFLSKAEAATAIFLAATAYGVGKTFFWPTMLGITAERFPRGGALTLNTVGGVGMLGVGVIGAVLLGNIQDREVDRTLAAQHPAVHEQVVGESKMSVFGAYRPISETKLKSAPEEAVTTVHQIQAGAKKSALKTVAVFPLFMFVCYLGLILYFKAKGGYKAEVLVGHEAEDKKFTGGTTGPSDL